MSDNPVDKLVEAARTALDAADGPLHYHPAITVLRDALAAVSSRRFVEEVPDVEREELARWCDEVLVRYLYTTEGDELVRVRRIAAALRAPGGAPPWQRHQYAKPLFGEPCLHCGKSLKLSSRDEVCLSQAGRAAESCPGNCPCGCHSSRAAGIGVETGGEGRSPAVSPGGADAGGDAGATAERVVIPVKCTCQTSRETGDCQHMRLAREDGATAPTQEYVHQQYECVEQPHAAPTPDAELIAQWVHTQNVLDPLAWNKSGLVEVVDSGDALATALEARSRELAQAQAMVAPLVDRETDLHSKLAAANEAGRALLGALSGAELRKPRRAVRLTIGDLITAAHTGLRAVEAAVLKANGLDDSDAARAAK